MRLSCGTGSVFVLSFSEMTRTLSFLLALLVSHVFGSSWARDPNVVKAANFAVGLHNRMANCAYAFKVVDVLSDRAELYPPAWVKYSIEVRVAQTNCRNDGKVKLEDCSLKTNGQNMICNFVVLAVPGENTVPRYLLSEKCT